jgi:hypothetical protein
VGGVVTISSSYGAGGALVGPVVAEALGLAFYDRAIPAAVAEQLSVETAEAEARDERPPRRSERLLNALANMSVPLGPVPPIQPFDLRSGYCKATEEVLVAIAEGAGGVVLGRAAMVVLAGRPNVLRVRLDGPADARVQQAMRLLGLNEEAARAEQRDTDRTRELYAQAFYGASQSDPRLYHLILDSTALPFELCSRLIVEAARTIVSRPDLSYN